MLTDEDKSSTSPARLPRVRRDAPLTGREWRASLRHPQGETEHAYSLPHEYSKSQ